MAFKLDQSPSYRWPVKVAITGEDGEPEEYGFQVDFKRLQQSEVEAVLEAFQSKELKDRIFCQKNVCGWDQVQSADGIPVPFSQEGLLKLSETVHVAGAVVLAWIDSLKVGQEKNSEKQPELGPITSTAIN